MCISYNILFYTVNQSFCNKNNIYIHITWYNTYILLIMVGILQITFPCDQYDRVIKLCWVHSQCIMINAYLSQIGVAAKAQSDIHWHGSMVRRVRASYFEKKTNDSSFMFRDRERERERIATKQSRTNFIFLPGDA